MGVTEKCVSTGDTFGRAYRWVGFSLAAGSLYVSKYKD